ncbi:hypothetical protein [Ktedonobacter racemifer]|uniref:Uncharacterized protein n=1 Tax=Ktedonobacter racemifer DSM 44963 TaxID=485913 RepID=D6TKV1_KTERA|nr:hypothetical protein [Ktedonobacter racemifer]EFH86401.1 hypothetical protein Krac_7699 [Ktedonobacter racemifer DSM 44963]
MSKKQQPQETWSLWNRDDITLAPGTFIEYRHLRQVRVARVERVRVISSPSYPDKQVIDVKRYGPLRRHDGPRAGMVQPDEVIRTLDGPPPPAPKALTSLWSPRDAENPFRVECPLSNEEWREISLWYPFSIRSLEKKQGEKGIWQEQARTYGWNDAKETMQALAATHNEQTVWVAMKCERRGKEGREKLVMWYPDQWNVQDALRKVGLLKTT